MIEKSQKNWTDAQRFCRKNHTDLASVRNRTENNEIKNAFKSDTQINDVWIGLFCDSWEWSDSSNSTFRNWKSDEPNSDAEKCTEANMNNGEWNNVACSEPRTFVCHEGE